MRCFCKMKKSEKLCKIFEMHWSCYLETLVDSALMNGNYLKVVCNKEQVIMAWVQNIYKIVNNPFQNHNFGSVVRKKDIWGSSTAFREQVLYKEQLQLQQDLWN